MADIVFISAPIGGGKSLYATRAICLELKRTDRMIVTNVPIFLSEDDFPVIGGVPGGKQMLEGPDYDIWIKGQREARSEKFLTLGEWCHEYVDRPIDVASRVRRLKDHEVSNFFRYLPGWDVPLREQSYHGSISELPDLELRAHKQSVGEIPCGCLFIIDEAHMFFSAREWQSVGRGMEFYRSQLRKLNDDLLLATQHVEKVDKNCRRDATEFLYLTNFSRRKLFGGVTLPGRFGWASYPQQAMRQDTPTNRGWLQLEDQNFHKCYNTMAGVGISGKLEPEGSRIKGRHWSVWLAMLGALMLAAWYIPHWLVTGANVGVKHALSGLHGPLEKKPNEVVHGAVVVGDERKAPIIPPGPVIPGNGFFKPRLGDGQSVVWQRDVIVDGYEMTGGLVTVMLSDGTAWQFGDGHFNRWENNVAFIDGVAYRMLTDAERARWERQRLMQGAGVVPGGRR